MTKKFLVFSLSIVAFIALFIVTALYPQGFMTGGSISYTLTFALLFVLFIWGISMYYRVQYDNQKKIILSIIITLILWTIIKYLKWLPNIHLLAIYLDYIYYIPMVMIPLLFSALCIEAFFKDTKWRKPYYIITSIVSSLFIVAVFTNDLHHLIYDYTITIDDVNPVIEHISYGYGILHYIAMVYIGLMTLFTFTIFAIGVRKKVTVWQILVPLLIYFLILSYSVLYLLGLNIIKSTPLIKDFATMITILLLLMLEALLDVGLIRNNGLYLSNFKKSAIPMCIYDEYDDVLFKTNTFINTKPNDINYRYNTKIEEYYKIVVEENLEEIIELKEKIESENEKIERINEFVLKTIEINSKNQSILNKTKLVNEIEKDIKYAENIIKDIVHSIPDELTSENEKDVMEKLGIISLLLGYMKQKCMLLIEFKKNSSMTLESFKFLLNVIKSDISSAGYLNVAFNVISKSSDNVNSDDVLIINDFLNRVAYDYAFTNSNMLVIINLDNKKVTIDLDGDNLVSKELIIENTNITYSTDDTFRISMGWQNE